jgi:hypothetical protein
MQQALKDIDNIIFLLNKQLKRQIGNDVYHIKKEPNPEFRFYRDLIHMNATRDPDDLFFASLEGGAAHRAGSLFAPPWSNMATARRPRACSTTASTSTTTCWSPTSPIPMPNRSAWTSKAAR